MMGQRNHFVHRRWWLVAFVVVVVLVGLYQLKSWWVSPEHRVGQFQAAIEKLDAKALFALADPAETERLGLTLEKLRIVLADAAQSPGGVILVSPVEESFSDWQRGFNRTFFYTMTGKNGKRLESTNERSKGKARVYVTAYRNKTGWHICLSQFLRSVALSRYPGRYRALLQRHGLPHEILSQDGSRWERL